jgi:hypothetical protein
MRGNCAASIQLAKLSPLDKWGARKVCAAFPDCRAGEGRREKRAAARFDKQHQELTAD